MTRKLFFWWTKTKRCWSSCTFPYKAAKIAQVIMILRKFVPEDLTSAISFLLDRHTIFICSITGFRAIDSPPHPPCASTPLSYIVLNMWTHVHAKAFVGTKGGGRYAIKKFLISICFIVKKHSFFPKLSPSSIPKGKRIPLSQNTEFKETFLRKQ